MGQIHPRITERAREPRYTFAEAGRLIHRQPNTLRRWALGHDRVYRGKARHDDALIAIDGSLDGSTPPLSFLNLIELRFLASWRTTISLPFIRQALAFAGEQLGKERPLLELDFKHYGRKLFVDYENQLVSATPLQGQLMWPEMAEFLFESVEYDEDEQAAYRWWPLGKDRPVALDIRVNGGRPTTSTTGVRTVAIATRLRDGYSFSEIEEDTAATPQEIKAAAEIEGVAA